MKKIAFWNNYTCFAKNQAFNPDAYGIGEDIGYPIMLLKEKFESRGYVLETLDMDDAGNYEAVIFSDYPDPKTCCVDINQIPKEKRFLILSECQMIYKQNSRSDLLNDFQKVFAYNDDLVNSAGYIKLNIPNRIKLPAPVDFSKKKFSTLIAGNKRVNDKGELYTERLRAISYMEKKHFADFDLYGIGWDLKVFSGPKIVRALNRFSFLKKVFADKHPSYKGRLNKKLETLSNYKFCFCYENSKSIPGYISEKIWDCFFAGCVPIYYGAPNVTDYIPENTFIDFRKFKSYDELYGYIKNMTQEEYNLYIGNIVSFLKSGKAYQFSADCFSDTIISEILK